MEKLFVIIPAYNESSNIKACVDDWYPVVEAHNIDGGSRLVIINDGSKDDTLQVLEQISKNRLNILVRRSRLSGVARATCPD